MEQGWDSMLRDGAIKVRRFLRSNLNKEFLTFLFFVFVSAGFWLLETLNEDYEREISVPVKYLNVPNNVVITSDIPNEIKATIVDKGFMLVNYMFAQKPRPIEVNFLDYEAKGSATHINSNEIQKQLLKSFESSSRLVSFKPESFDMVYTRGKAKRVPVRLKGNVSAKQQYDITHILFSPDTLTIYAPEEVLDTIHVVFTNPVSFHELDDTLSVESEMAHLKNVKIVPDKVNLKICVAQLTQKTIEVPIEPINVPEGKIMRTFPAKVKVTCQMVLANFNSVDANEFTIQVDYKDLKEGDTKCHPVVVRYPSTIKHLSFSPQTIDFLVEDE